MAEREDRGSRDRSQTISDSTVGRDAYLFQGVSRVIIGGTSGRRWVVPVIVFAIVAAGGFAFTERGRRMLSGHDGPNVTVTAAPGVCDQRSGWIVGDTSAPPPDGALAVRDPRRYRTWLNEHGAVPAKQSETIVTVNGSGSAAVVIEDIKITVIRRSPPRPGRHMVPKCGGSLPPDKHYAPVALDEFPVGQPVSLRQKIGSSSYGKATTRVLGTVPVVKFPFVVTKTDYSYVNLVAVADECDCTWNVEVEWLNGERRGIHRPGKTFELSAVAAGSPRSSP